MEGLLRLLMIGHRSLGFDFPEGLACLSLGGRCHFPLKYLVVHFFTFSPSPRKSAHPNIAGFGLTIAGVGGFESNPIANSNSVRILLCGFQLIDMQKHVGTTTVVCDKSESAVSIPHLQFSSTHLFSFFEPQLYSRRCIFGSNPGGYHTDFW